MGLTDIHFKLTPAYTLDTYLTDDCLTIYSRLLDEMWCSTRVHTGISVHEQKGSERKIQFKRYLAAHVG